MKKTMKHTSRIRAAVVLAAACLIVGTPAWSQAAPDYTKGEKPVYKGRRWAIGPTGAHGYIHHTDARQIWIDPFLGIDKGSPADGTLQEGDVILGVLSPTTGQDTGNGMSSFDARRSMAIAIEEAEKKAHGGKLVLNIWRPNGRVKTWTGRPPDERKYYRNSEGELVKNLAELREFQPAKPLSGKIMPVTLKLEVMGSYSATSPWDCEKNEALVDKLAGNIVKNGFSDGIVGPFDALGLLATGDKAHLPRLQAYARRIAARSAGYDVYKGGPQTWYAAYVNLFLTEYYLVTGDEQVLPGIKGASMYLAQGVSGVGTWGHDIANVKGNGIYGPPNGYGAMNQISLVCAMSLVLAQKCGIEDPAIDRAVLLALKFTRYYVDKGCIPYGDHAPTEEYDNNGRMSIAAVLYDLVGDKEAAEYFTRMTLASYETREQGHTGHFFAWNWGTLGAARGGPQAAASFLKNTRYFLEMERRFDGRCEYQRQLGKYSSHKTKGFGTTGQRLIQYCLPRKVLYITGKGGSSVTPITGRELKPVVHAPSFNPKQLSTEKLLNALGFWSLLVRRDAAIELGKRDENVVDELIAMLDSPNRYARYGACVGLRYAGRESTEAVDALVNKIENDNDMTLRYYATNALRLPPEEGADVNGLGNAPRRATDALLRLATVYDPEEDPMRKLGREIAYVLFHSDGRSHIPQAFFPKGKGAEKLDKALLIPALKSLLLNPNSTVRGYASSVLPRLPIQDLDKFWGEIYQATTTPAPSGVMFAKNVHLNGIETMAKNNIKEGVDYGAWYVLYKHGWGNYGRKKSGSYVILKYGRAMEPYFKDFEKVISKNLKGGGAEMGAQGTGGSPKGTNAGIS